MSVSFQASFQKPLALLNEGERPLLAVKVTPSTASSAVEERRSFHLALLIDVSGSMEGDRISAVKRTLHLLIDEMVSHDYVTLISYESITQTLARNQSTNDEGRTLLHAAIDRLEADGGTNLEAALLALYPVQRASDAVPLSAVLLLTDGHINQGLMGAVGISRLLSSVVSTSTPVFTLGFGADHDARLLRDIAMRSRGSYTYADAAEVIPATVGDILGGLTNLVAKEATLAIPTGWTCKEMGCNEGDTTYSIGNLIVDKPQWVVLEGPCASAEGPVEEPQLVLSYKLADSNVVTQRCELFSGIAPEEVVEQRDRAHVANVFGRVTEALERQEIPGAITLLTELGEVLDASSAKDRPLVICLRAQVDEMKDALQRSLNIMPPHTPGRLRRGLGGLGGTAPLPSIAPILSRMASNQCALGVQRGFLSALSSISPAASQDPTSPVPTTRPHGSNNMSHTFCSPVQQTTSATLQARFSQMSTTEAEDVNAAEESHA